jgi:hypothetical protein
MATNDSTSTQQQQASDQSLMEGFQKHISALPSLLIAGTSVPTTTVISTLQARIAARAATAPARATYQALVKANQDEHAKSQVLVSGAKQAVQLMFAGQIETLADFGLKPRKVPAPRTPQQKAASVAKAKATRAARHTMGSVQKAKVTGATPQGNVAAVPAPAPVTAPAAAPANGATR